MKNEWTRFVFRCIKGKQQLPTDRSILERAIVVEGLMSRSALITKSARRNLLKLVFICTNPLPFTMDLQQL